MEVVDTTDLFKVDDEAPKVKQEQEDDPRKIAQRMKQIEYGKNTLGYQNYIKLVPKHKRKLHGKDRDPQTPDAKAKSSKRTFDGQVKAWRRQLHEWDPQHREEGAGDGLTFFAPNNHPDHLEHQNPHRENEDVGPSPSRQLGAPRKLFTSHDDRDVDQHKRESKSTLPPVSPFSPAQHSPRRRSSRLTPKKGTHRLGPISSPMKVSGTPKKSTPKKGANIDFTPTSIGSWYDICMEEEQDEELMHD